MNPLKKENILSNSLINKRFVPTRDWSLILILALFGSYWNYIPYSHVMSILLQTAVLSGLFIVFRRRAAVLVAAYILLSILPARMYGGFNEDAGYYYLLNPQICIAFSLLFLAYGLFALQKNYRIKISVLLFVLVMVTSLYWTISSSGYDLDFWWMCVAYLFLPLFIDDESDLRLILIAYIVAVDVFCVRVLPIVASSSLERGMVNLDPNYAAFFVILSIGVILTMLTVYRSILTWKYILFLLASGLLAVVTMVFFESRTSFVMLIVLIIIYLWYNLKRFKTFLLSLISIIAAGIVLLQLGYFDGMLLRFEEPEVVTGGGRYVIQQYLLNAIGQFDGFRLLFGNGYLTSHLFGIGLQAHNSYINIMISFGFIGLIIYGLFLLEMFIDLRKGVYKPFLIMYYLLFLYGFSLEPYLMIEGILMFCVLNGLTKSRCTPEKFAYSGEIGLSTYRTIRQYS